MGHPPDPRHPGRKPIELAAAYTEVQNLLLDSPDVTDFLHQLAVVAAAIVPGSHCGVTMRRDKQVASVAGSDATAMQMDEIQYLRGKGPCLQTLRTGQRVDVTDMDDEQRWGDYRTHALTAGIGSAVSLPMRVGEDTLGALNLFADTAHGFGEPDVKRAESFTDQAAAALTILLRQARMLVLDEQLKDGLATRAVIDQALGILMVTRAITSTDAFAILRHQSQTTNRKLSDVATELIQATTGHPPQPPRPLTDRG